MLNVVAVVGRLVADPELRKTTTGISTTTLRVAVDRSYIKPGGERQTDFFDIVAWRSTAEFACKYFRKGQMIGVNGSLQSRSYEDKEGKKRTVYEIVADNLHFVESKSASAAASGGGQQSYSQSAPARNIEQQPAAYSSGEPEDFAVIDDSEDLPF